HHHDIKLQLFNKEDWRTYWTDSFLTHLEENRICVISVLQDFPAVRKHADIYCVQIKVGSTETLDKIVEIV
uniref:Uncharacterized protein n=1 Tax=Romanomermis culicivorax TaxID=13658 RepID=A0A915ITK9_ROMCU